MKNNRSNERGRVAATLAAVACAVALVAAAAAQEAPPAGPPVVDLANQPTLYVVGYAHLDTQWRWCYPITIREYLRNTLHDNFALFEKYPSYIFNFSGSRRYQMMQEYYPEDYKRLKSYIAAGRWFPCGSSVDENDANVPSAESLIRQVLYGNKYFQREFGVTSEEFMLPDCFGFPAALPSALAHCGLKGFSTQKLTWGSAMGIPFKVGVWEGPDRSSIVAAFDPGAYVGEVRSDLSRNDSWLTRVRNNGDRSGVFADYHYYGTGDMGGAPTEQSVAMIEQSVRGNGPLKVISSQADWLFKSITPAMREKLPRYQGELLLTEHSAGSITSQAYMKRWNRKNELLADAAEKAAATAWWLGAEYPAKRLEDAWYLVLGSQMHDILPGTSHPKAYEYSWNDEVLAANQFAAVLTEAVGAVSSVLDTRSQGAPLVVFNPLSIEREDVVEVNLPWTGAAPTRVRVIGPDRSEAPSQVLGASDGQLHLAILARVPAVGFAVFDVQAGAPAANESLKISERSLENERYRVTLNDDGDVAMIFDKRANRELLGGPARLALQYEKPRQWPAWNMDWRDRQQPPRSFVAGPAKFRIAERGPVRVALEVTREHEGSTYVQTIRLAAGDAGDRVEFDSTIDWATRERSLKASFPLSVSNPNATFDIQIGAIERPNNHEKAYEHPLHTWFDLTDGAQSYGVTIINDSKYGSDKPDDSTLRLTLLYTPGVSGDYQDQGTQDIGRHDMVYGVAGHEGDWRTAGTPWIAARMNQPLRAFIVPAHSGTLGRSFSLASASDPDVMITAIKKAEDSDRLIMRLRELTGSDARGVRIKLARPLKEVREVDGQERPIGGEPPRLADGELVTDVQGYGLRAFSFALGDRPASLVGQTTRPLTLPYDTDAISLNNHRDDGALDEEGRTLPGEQLGSNLSCNAIAFRLGSSAAGEPNALRCRGQEIDLPSGEFTRVELLAASIDGDHEATFTLNGEDHRAVVPWWRGYIGQWDNRIWTGNTPEVAFNWQASFAGLEPGYVKLAEVAWFATHHHAPASDQYYEFCYLYRVSIDLPASQSGQRTLTLPGNDRIAIFAATMVNSRRDRATPAAPLFDTLADRQADAPRISPGGGAFNDATELRIEPRLYGRAEDVRYSIAYDAGDAGSLNDNAAAWDGPVILQRSATVRAAMVGRDGRLGPEAVARIEVNDSTPPTVREAFAVYNQPTVRVTFNEPLDQHTAAEARNYTIDPPVEVRRAQLQEPGNAVALTLAAPLQSNVQYTLRIHNVADSAPSRNAIGESSVALTAPGRVFHLATITPEQRGKEIRPEKPLPVKARDAWTLNMFVRAEREPPNRTLIAGFGSSTARTQGGSRYLAKFSNGVHFWSHNSDLPGNAPFDVGQWQMLTATCDGRTLRLYKNGELLGERAVNLADDDPVVWIAPIDPWDRRRQFEGEVREFAIWNAALGHDEIKSLHSGTQLP